MRIEVHFDSDVPIVSLSGKFLAGGDGPYLRQKIKDLLDAGARKLVIDFAAVPYIDSTGLGFLAGARVTTQNSGATLVLSGINQYVRRILDDLKLAQFFQIEATLAAAVEKLKKLPPGQEAGTQPAKEPKTKKSPVKATESAE